MKSVKFRFCKSKSWIKTVVPDVNRRRFYTVTFVIIHCHPAKRIAEDKWCYAVLAFVDRRITNCVLHNWIWKCYIKRFNCHGMCVVFFFFFWCFSLKVKFILNFAHLSGCHPVCVLAKLSCIWVVWGVSNLKAWCNIF